MPCSLSCQRNSRRSCWRMIVSIFIIIVCWTQLQPIGASEREDQEGVTTDHAASNNNNNNKKIKGNLGSEYGRFWVKSTTLKDTQQSHRNSKIGGSPDHMEISVHPLYDHRRTLLVQDRHKSGKEYLVALPQKQRRVATSTTKIAATSPPPVTDHGNDDEKENEIDEMTVANPTTATTRRRTRRWRRRKRHCRRRLFRGKCRPQQLSSSSPTIPPPTTRPTTSFREPSLAPTMGNITNSPSVSPRTKPPIVKTTNQPSPDSTDFPTSAETFSAPPTTVPSIGSCSSQEINFIIQDVSLNGGIDFMDPDSYQNQALTWLCQSNRTGLVPWQMAQRWVLACFYYATFRVPTVFTEAAFPPGVLIDWFNSSRWLTDTDECLWARIRCNQNRRVEMIDMSTNGLTGTMPPEIVRFNNSLEILLLSYNFVFASPEFRTVLGQLVKLKDLFYGNTNFISYEGIPTEINQLKNLRFYDATNVLYEGPVSQYAFSSDMTALRRIQIGNNSLSGTIPLEMVDLPSLEFFHIPNCVFSGTLPNQIGPFDQMWSLQLNGNWFSGTIPSTWEQYSKLYELKLQNNPFLQGTIPDDVCGLPVLEADCDICLASPSPDCCTNICP